MESLAAVETWRSGQRHLPVGPAAVNQHAGEAAVPEINARIVDGMVFTKADKTDFPEKILTGNESPGASGSGGILVVQLTQQSRIFNAADTLQLNAGDMVLIGREPGVAIWSESEGPQLRVYLPRGVVLRRHAGIRSRGFHVIDGNDGIGLVTRKLLLAVFDECSALSRLGGSAAHEALMELLISAIGASAVSQTNATSLMQQHCELIKHFVEAHLDEADLAPNTVAISHRISVRHLHRLFTSSGISFGSWVRERRLEKCRQEIESPAMADIALTQIAYHWGFNDMSHFSRLFREKFGLPPSEYRKRALQAIWAHRQNRLEAVKVS